MKTAILLLFAFSVFSQTQGISGNYGVTGNIALSTTAFSHPVMTPTFSSGFTVANPSGGDTQMYTWTTAATKAGNWSGVGGSGSIVGVYNDGGGFGCPDNVSPTWGRSICVYQITAYDPTMSSVTISLVNSMDSYLTSAASSCYDGVRQMKSRKPFAFDGVIFLPIFCMSGPVATPAFAGYQSGYIVSPDGGAHWCNYKSFNAHSGSPDCDSSNWQATGDNPVDAAGFQFPLADGTNKMTRMQIVDYLCQDNTVACPSASGVDTAHLYFITSPTANGNTAYLIRVLKSVGWRGLMNPSNFEAYASGSWSSTLQNATDVSGGVALNTCCSTFTFMGDFGIFVAWVHSSTTSIPYATAPAPWGPWTSGGSFSIGGVQTGFPGPIAGLCPTYGTPGRVICTIASSPTEDLRLAQVDLGAR